MRKTMSVLVLAALLTFVAAFACAEFDIPAGVTLIDAGAFENAELGEAEITFPAELRRIESRAFAGTGITKVYLPETISYIAPDAFDGCTDFHPSVDEGSYAEQWCSENGVTPYVISGLGAATRSESEIRDFIASNPTNFTDEPEYRNIPSGGAYGGSEYQYALLTEEAQNSAIAAVNQVRYIAGLDANVVNYPEKEDAVGAAAMVNALNNALSHYPDRPEALADARYDDVYTLACQGASSSNLHVGYNNLARTVLSYMDDSDGSNIDRVGHRRWILNPSMGKTTFGFYKTVTTYSYGGADGQTHSFDYENAFSGMYSFDRSGSGAQKRVAWPAQNMPLDYFGGNYCAWSVSFGQYLTDSAIHVELEQTGTGRKWTFSADQADGAFFVDNGGYGLTGCVIFLPNGLELKAGDSYLVTITDDEHYRITRYTVHFFGL